MRWLTLLLALVLWPLAAHAQDGGRGTLTILTGTPLAGVTIALFHDTDTDGPVLIMTTTTDAEGRITASDLAWGLYIVQFQGTAPDGRPMLPADQQNMGVLTDGNGLSGGFGLRVAEAQRTESAIRRRVWSSRENRYTDTNSSSVSHRIRWCVMASCSSIRTHSAES